jgi:hypothetical protein
MNTSIKRTRSTMTNLRKMTTAISGPILQMAQEAAVLEPSPQGGQLATWRTMQTAEKTLRTHPDMNGEENDALRDSVALLTVNLTRHHLQSERARRKAQPVRIPYGHLLWGHLQLPTERIAASKPKFTVLQPLNLQRSRWNRCQERRKASIGSTR